MFADALRHRHWFLFHIHNLYHGIDQETDHALDAFDHEDGLPKRTRQVKIFLTFRTGISLPRNSIFPSNTAVREVSC